MSEGIPSDESMDEDRSDRVLRSRAALAPKSSWALVPVQPKRVRKRKLQDEGVDPEKLEPIEYGHDDACWTCLCHEATVTCRTCPRMFHGGRCHENMNSSGMCMLCVEATNQESLYCDTYKLSMEDIKEIFRHVLLKIESLKEFINLNFEHSYLHPMDLKILKMNVENDEYGSPYAFFSDVRWIYFNHLTKAPRVLAEYLAAKQIQGVCDTEKLEIDRCVHCYRSIISGIPDPFIEVCKTPHLLVWATYSNWAPWPAKVYDRDDAHVNIRFFGERSVAKVPLKKCQLLTKTRPHGTGKSKKSGLPLAIRELGRHISNLEENFGKFLYREDRVFMSPTTPIEDYLREMLPEWNTPYNVPLPLPAPVPLPSRADPYLPCVAAPNRIKQAEDTLAVFSVVTITSSPGVLDNDYANELNTTLGIAAVRDCTFHSYTLRFEGCEFQDDCILVKTYDARSRDWLLTTVSKMTRRGHRLVASEEPRPVSATVFLNGCSCPSDYMINAIGTQNPTLNTKKWKVTGEEQTPEGLTLLIDLQEPEVKELAATDYQVFWFLKRSKVILPPS